MQIVSEIAKSLASDQESWTLHELSHTTYVSCDESHEQAMAKDCSERYSSLYRWAKDDSHCNKRIYFHWVRPDVTKSLELRHSGGIVLRDDGSETYTGWKVKTPAHITLGWWQSYRLSRAVRKWREWNVAWLLTDAKERDLRAAAWKEVEALDNS